MEVTISNTDVDITTEQAPVQQDSNFEIVMLDAAKVQLFRNGGSAVRATVTDPVIGPERTYLRVFIARAFPLSKPTEYIGLRDEKDKDIGMMQTLKGMDTESRAIVDEELARRYFVPQVSKVISIKEEGGTVTWEVETDKGPRTFIVQNMRESLYTIGAHRYLLADKDGVRYEFPDVRQLEMPQAGGKMAQQAASLLNRTSSP